MFLDRLKSLVKSARKSRKTSKPSASQKRQPASKERSGPEIDDAVVGKNSGHYAFKSRSASAVTSYVNGFPPGVAAEYVEIVYDEDDDTYYVIVKNHPQADYDVRGGGSFGQSADEGGERDGGDEGDEGDESGKDDEVKGKRADDKERNDRDRSIDRIMSGDIDISSVSDVLRFVKRSVRRVLG